MRAVIVLFLILLTFKTEAQIKTFYKGDTIVILSSIQAKVINKRIEDQEKRIQELELMLTRGKRENVNLLDEIDYKDSVIAHEFDSLNRVHDHYTWKVDSFSKRVNELETWIVNSAQVQSFIYFDYDSLKVKELNLTKYKARFSHLTGTLRISPPAGRMIGEAKQTKAKLGLHKKLQVQIKKMIWEDWKPNIIEAPVNLSN
jgi:hypothetical protein